MTWCTVIDPITGAAQEHRHLKIGDKSRKWLQGAANKIGRLVQGTLPDIPTGTNTLFFIPYVCLPVSWKATNLKIVAEEKHHKVEKKQVQFTCSGECIKYPGNTATKGTDLTTSKILLNSVTSTQGA